MGEHITTEKRLKIAVTAEIRPDFLEKLREIGDVEVCGWIKTGVLMSEAEQIEALRGVHVYLVGYELVSERVIANCPSLELVACARANPVNVDTAALEARRIPLLYTPGRNAVAAAEFTMGLMLAEARHIARAYRSLREGRFLGAPAADILDAPEKSDVVWNLSGESPYKYYHGFELHGKTLSLLGLGHIGRMVARYAQAFDMRVLSHDPYFDEAEARALGVTLVDLPTLFREADFLSIHCKVSEETKGIVNADAFSRMKKTAVLVNTARASIVDQAALVDALRNKTIAGAALDVYWEEPLPSNHPLLTMDNATLTPHLAGASFDVPERHSEIVVEDILRWAEGKTPYNIW